MTPQDLGLFAKLYLDADVHKRVAKALRLRGFDVVSAPEVGQVGLRDEEQLRYAVSQRRAMVTFNVRDYVRWHREYSMSGSEHYGIILSEQLPIGEMIRRLLAFLNKFIADEVMNNLWWLQA